MAASASPKFNSFASTSSVHGLNRVADISHSKARRVIWLVVVLVSTGVFTVTLLFNVMKYFEYPTSTSVTIEYRDRAAFPSITVCNNNQMSQHVMDQQPVAKMFFDNSLQKYTGSVVNVFDDNETMAWLNKTDVITFFYNSSTTNRHSPDGSVSKEPLIKNCFYGTQASPCPPVTHSTVSVFGHCVTLNLKNKTSPYVVSRPGITGGFMFEYDISQDDYSTQTVSLGAGARVMVHAPDTVPPVAEAFSVMPGTEVQVVVTHKQNIRLSKPYNTLACTEQNTYAFDECMVDCYTGYFEIVCNCNIDLAQKGSLHNCTFSQMAKCVADVWKDVYEKDNRGDGKSCGCLYPCSETTYSTQLSYLQYPSHKAGQIMKTLDGRNVTYMRNNNIHINVILKSLNIEKTVQRAAYAVCDLMSDVGGLMGLFVGASIISISEFIEFFMDVFLFRLDQRRKRKLTIVRPQENDTNDKN